MSIRIQMGEKKEETIYDLHKTVVGQPLFKVRTIGNDDEHVDRLSHRVTVCLILFCFFITSTALFVPSRISCWSPAELKRDDERYTKYMQDYCWTINTYYIDTDVIPPHSNEDRRQAQISSEDDFFCNCRISLFLGYYQWVPILLLLMALGFYAPRLFWRSFNIRSGIDIQNLVKKSERNAEHAIAILEYYCHSITSIHPPPPINISACYRRGKHRGNYLFSIYLLTRFMYLANSIFQLFFLNVLLGHRGNAWFINWNIIRNILHRDNSLFDSPYFPRVTLCDVPIREFGEIHRYTIQCLLPINILNEYIFFILSFWFAYLVIQNIISFILLIIQIRITNRIEYVKHLLPTDDNRQIIQSFTEQYLTYDGLLLLRLLSHNSCQPRVIRIVQELLQNYKNRRTE